MKRLLLLLLVVSAASCAHRETENKEKLLAVNAESNGKENPYAAFSGTWKGTIAQYPVSNRKRDQEIRIALPHISDPGHVQAYKFMSGRRFDMDGKLTKRDAATVITFADCDHTGKPKGELALIFENGSVKGSWKPDAQPKEPASEIQFALSRLENEYRPEVTTDSSYYIDFDHPKKEKKARTKYVRASYPMTSDAVIGLNASNKKLSESDLKNLKKPDLQFLRNTVYARHGYIFQTQSLTRFFSEFDWYVPTSTNVENELTALEKSNLKLIKRFERYAEEYYEYFGR